MKQFPHEYQMDLTDCGPACLKIIARFYGQYYSLQYLRERCGKDREGVSFLDLSYAAENIGFRSVALKATVADLHHKIPLPCVIHWAGSHFVVIYKTTKTRIWISDPAKGKVSYSWAEFADKWYSQGESKGSLLVLEPQADFKQRRQGEKQDRRKTFQQLLGYFTPYRKSFTNLFVVMLLVTVLQAVLPFISKAVIDVGIQTHDLNFINLVLIANIAIIVSITLSNAVRDWILLHITSRVNISLIADYLIKLMKLPVTFFENKMTGDILQRASDHERIRSFIMNNSLNLIFSSLTFLIFGIVLLIYHKIIFYIFLGGSTLYILWVLGFLRARKKLDWEYFELVARNQSYWVETIASIQDIKINNYEKFKRWKWESIQARLFRVNQRVLNINNVQNGGAQFIDALKNLFITFYCAKAVINGEITFGVFISTQFIIGMLNGPVQQFISFIMNAQFAHISFLRLNEIHQLEDEEEEHLANSIVLPQNKSLLLKNVSFRYSTNSPPVLKNIHLMIPEGKVTAIVGDSGSGKSTLLKLLLRLYRPSFGEISIGGMNISNINLRQWRNISGAVMQDGKIFNDTIMNNIVLDDEHLDHERLQQAVNVANIAYEIEQMPLGYNTMMGEMGRGLSGGQKQRILIARALYKDPEYLFFDEATNSLDALNEQKIVQALDEVFNGKTAVVVAHRLSTIRKADQIVVLKDGFVVETGNHEKLMERKRFYYKLVSSQMGYPGVNEAEKEPEQQFEAIPQPIEREGNAEK